MKTVTVRQHIKFLPKQCCRCPPVKKTNTYSVYAGLTQESENEILRIDEISDDWNRHCCNPYHPLKLEVRQYFPIPNKESDASKFSTEYRYLREDFAQEVSSLTGYNRQQAIEDWYKSQPVLFTMIRDDGQRCCCKMPCKLLNTFVCCGFCQDGMHAYAGQLIDGPEKGRLNNPDPTKLIGSVKQPSLGGCCTPSLHLTDGHIPEPFGKVEGPCCFGGWSENCCSFNFFVSKFGSGTKAGDLGKIIKKKPDGLSGQVKEVMSQADVYSVQFNDGVELSPAQKITILTSQILSDYM